MEDFPRLRANEGDGGRVIDMRIIVAEPPLPDVRHQRACGETWTDPTRTCTGRALRDTRAVTDGRAMRARSEHIAPVRPGRSVSGKGNTDATRTYTTDAETHGAGSVRRRSPRR